MTCNKSTCVLTVEAEPLASVGVTARVALLVVVHAYTVRTAVRPVRVDVTVHPDIKPQPVRKATSMFFRFMCTYVLTRTNYPNPSPTRAMKRLNFEMRACFALILGYLLTWPSCGLACPEDTR